MYRQQTLAFLSGLLVLCAVSGCAMWDPGVEPIAGDSGSLTLPRLALDTVILEIAFVTVPSNDPAVGDDLWHELDEQHLPTDLRRRLLDNGLRCGLAGMQLPQALRDQMATSNEGKTGNGNEQGAVIETGATPTQRRLQARSGRRSEIVLKEKVESMVVLYKDENRILGDTYEQAQGILAAKAFPLGDGRVELELTPEVHYGQPKQDWVGRDGVFRLDASREHKTFERLQLKATLSPGQTLIMTCSAPAAGLGSAFFCDKSSDGKTQKLVLIRLAQTQYDDQLAPKVKAPVESEPMENTPVPEAEKGEVSAPLSVADVKAHGTD
jgi:hypothetical protein